MTCVLSKKPEKEKHICFVSKADTLSVCCETDVNSVRTFQHDAVHFKDLIVVSPFRETYSSSSSSSSRQPSISRDNGKRLGWSSMMLRAVAGVAQEPHPGMTVFATVVADVWGRWVGILQCMFY